MSGNPKDRFYYNVSEYLRRSNPNITNEEVSLKVDEYRASPETFYATAYKDLSGGKTIDKKTLLSAGEMIGLDLDPTKLGPNQINYVDNEKRDILDQKKVVSELQSKMKVPIGATDAEIDKFYDNQQENYDKKIKAYGIKGAQVFGVPGAMVGAAYAKVEKMWDNGSFGFGSDEEEKKKFRDAEKKKQEEFKIKNEELNAKLENVKLEPVTMDNFFLDAQKKTQKTKSYTLKPSSLVRDIFTEGGDFFKGNDVRQERMNAQLDSESYLNLIEEKLQSDYRKIKDPIELKMLSDLVAGKQPEIPDDFKPSKELQNFFDTQNVLQDQKKEVVSVFGSNITSKKSMTYTEQLNQLRQLETESRDKNQGWFTSTADEFTGVKPPSKTRTWFNGAVLNMVNGITDIGDAFNSDKLEEDARQALKNGDKDKYLRIQSKLALNDYFDDKIEIKATSRGSDDSAAVWAGTIDIDGFQLEIGSNKEIVRMVAPDGKTVHNLSAAQKNAVQKYYENPDAYDIDYGFSRSAGKSVINSAGQSAVEMIPMIAGGMATSGLRGMGFLGNTVSKVTPIAGMFVPQYTRYFDEEFKRTGNWSKASSYGTAMAGAEAALEWVAGPEARLIERIASPQIVTAAARRAASAVQNATDLANFSFMKEFGKQLIKDIGEEEATEILTLYAHSGINAAFDRESGVSVNDLITTVLVTPLATAPFSIVSNAANYSKPGNFRDMVVAAAQNYDQTVSTMAEMEANGLTNSEDSKKKLQLVEAVKRSMDFYSEKASSKGLSFDEKENEMLQAYMFEEALAAVNGKKVDYQKEIDSIFNSAAKRVVIEKPEEVNDPIIEDMNENTDMPEAEGVPVSDNEPNGPLPSDEGNNVDDEDILSSFGDNVKKDENNFTEKNTIGVDGKYSSFTNDKNIKQGDLAINFNISKEDAASLNSEIKNIAAKNGIPVRIDLAKEDNLTDIPLVLSFNNAKDAKTLHKILSESDIYRNIQGTNKERSLGFDIDGKSQFNVGNIKDYNELRDFVDNVTQDEDGGYIYEKDGDIIPLTKEEYDQKVNALSRPDNMWNESYSEPDIQQETPVQPEENLSSNNGRPTETPINTRNAQQSTSIQSAFDYKTGDNKEMPASYKKTNGVLKVNEKGQITFDDGRSVTDLGNMSNNGSKTLTELGIDPTPEFKQEKANEVVVDGRTFVNLFDSIGEAITFSESGSIESVSLQEKVLNNSNGTTTFSFTPRVFTGMEAIDMVVAFHENELRSEPDAAMVFENTPLTEVEAALVIPNVTIEYVADSIMPFFPGRPEKALEMAKIYFVVSSRMAATFPIKYPRPESYILEMVQGMNDNIVMNDTENLINYLQGLLSNKDLDKQSIDNIKKHIEELVRFTEENRPPEVAEIIDKINNTENVLIRTGIIDTNNAIFGYKGLGNLGTYNDISLDGDKSAYSFPSNFMVKNMSDIPFSEYTDGLRQQMLQQGYDGVFLMDENREPVIDVINYSKLTLIDSRLPNLIQVQSIEDFEKEQDAELDYLLQDGAAINRERGYFIRDGIRYDRNLPLTGLVGEKGKVRFTNKIEVPFTYRIVEASTLAPSHSGGGLNPYHFIPEAQPKPRTDDASIAAELSFATNPKFELLVGDTDAYGGAPVVNDLGEVIQGNNRTAGLKMGYNSGNKIYRSDLIANAEALGFNTDKVAAMNQPVLVRVLNVTDEVAIELGNYDAKDLETGGRGRVDPTAVSRRIPFNVKGKLADTLFAGDETNTLLASIRSNQKSVISILTPYLNETQRNTMFDGNNLTEIGVEDVSAIVEHFLFNNGDVSLPQIYADLTDVQKKGLLRSIPFLFSVTPNKSILKDIQNVMIITSTFINSRFKSYEDWLYTIDIFAGGSPSTLYSPFELALVDLLRNARSQKDIYLKFKEYAEAVTGVEGDMFRPATDGVSKIDGIKQIFKVDHNERVKEIEPQGVVSSQAENVGQEGEVVIPDQGAEASGVDGQNEQGINEDPQAQEDVQVQEDIQGEAIQENVQGTENVVTGNDVQVEEVVGSRLFDFKKGDYVSLTTSEGVSEYLISDTNGKYWKLINRQNGDTKYVDQDQYGFDLLEVDNNKEQKKKDLLDKINSLPDNMLYITHITPDGNAVNIYNSSLTMPAGVSSTTGLTTKEGLYQIMSSLIDGISPHRGYLDMFVAGIDPALLENVPGTSLQNKLENYLDENFIEDIAKTQLPSSLNIGYFTDGVLTTKYDNSQDFVNISENPIITESKVLEQINQDNIAPDVVPQEIPNVDNELEAAKAELQELNAEIKSLAGNINNPNRASNAQRKMQLQDFIKNKENSSIDSKIKDKAAELLAKFKEMRSKGNGIGIIANDPDQQERDAFELMKMGAELMALFVQKGYMSFKQIADEIIELTGEKSQEFINELKKLYMYATIENESLVDNASVVRNYKRDDVIFDEPKLNDPKEREKVEKIKEEAEKVKDEIINEGNGDPVDEIELLEQDLIIEEANNLLGVETIAMMNLFDDTIDEKERSYHAKDMLTSDFLNKGIGEFGEIMNVIYGIYGTKLESRFNIIRSTYDRLRDTNFGYESIMEADTSSYTYDSMFNKKSSVDQFVDTIRKNLRDGIKMNIINLRSIAKQSGIETFIDTDIQEYVELAIIENAKDIAMNNTLTQREKFDQVVALYELQPTISMRSSIREMDQQFSTPIPMSFMMGEFINAIAPKTVLEPSAGNGMLVFNIPSSKITVNEKDPVRLTMLAKQRFKEVLNQDGRDPFNGTYDAVVTNPPFGSSPKRMYGEYAIAGLDEQMAINALESMNDNGRAAIIMGGHMKYGDNGGLISEKMFFNYLHNYYNVVDTINIAGKLYYKQGTTAETRIILIDGRRKDTTTRRYAPLLKDVNNEVVTDFEELFNRINNIKDEILSNTGNGGINPDRLSGTARNGWNRSGGSSSGQGGRSGGGGKGTSISGQGEINFGLFGSGNRPNDGDGVSGSNNADGSNGGVNNENGTNDFSGDIPGTVDVDIRRDNDVQLSDRTDGVIDVSKSKVDYIPVSKGTPVGSKIPLNMAQALNRILPQFGDIDTYLQNKLRYKSKNDLYKALSAEQIDGVALAIYQIEKGNAIVIGDQAGLGKGRMGAALIRYAVLQGKKPIFITEKGNLFSDMYRDLKGIGSESLVPFIVNAKGAENPSMTDENGNIVHSVLPASIKDPIINSGSLPNEFDYIVATYSQFQSDKMTPKKEFLANMMRNNIFIFDESHNASGNGAGSAFIQSIIPSTKGGAFMSATFAKTPENMPLYALKTDMKDANLSTEEMIMAISQGGVPLQEVMANNLTETGQMIRRERDFDEVVQSWETLDGKKEEHSKTFDKVIDIFKDIIDFQKDYVEDVIGNLDNELVEMAGGAEITKGVSGFGITNTPFASKTFNSVRQLLLSVKSKEIADAAIEELKAGNKPVIALGSTMESFLKDMEIAEGTVIENLDFARVLSRGLDGVLRYTEKNLFETVKKSLTVEDLSLEGQDEYYRILEKINTTVSGITISPIDDILKRIRSAGFVVEEITGRSEILNFQDDGTAIAGRRRDKNKNRLVLGFNSGKIDALIINQSGSTGLSIHASSTFSDQKERVMLFAQPQLDINTQVQIMGRIDRTGQVKRGRYRYIISAIPAEQRLMMMFKNKLKSLNANTTGDQSSSELNEGVDFLNKYGDQIVIEYLKENPDINDRLQDPFKMSSMTEKGKDEFTSKEGAASTVTSKVALLTVREQEAFYKEVGERYIAQIKYLDDNNSNDLVIKTMPLNAETKNKTIVVKGRDNGSPFSEDSVLEEVEIDILRKPMKAEEVRSDINSLTNGLSPLDFKTKMVAELKFYEQIAIQKNLAKIEQDYDIRAKKLILEHESMMNIWAEKNGIVGTQKDFYVSKVGEYFNSTNENLDVSNPVLGKLLDKKEEFQQDKRRRKDSDLVRIQTRISSISKYAHGLTIGKSYLIPTTINITPETAYSNGLFMGFKYSEDKMVPSSMMAIFAVQDGRRKVEIPLSKVQYLDTVLSSGFDNSRMGINLDTWDSKIPSVSRKRAYIITGNLLQSYAVNKHGQLLSYTTNTGAIKQGILMPDNYEAKKQMMRVEISAGLEDLRVGKVLMDTTGDIKLERERGGYSISVPKSQIRGNKYSKDTDLLDMVSNRNFTQMGNNMIAYIPESRIEDVLGHLSKKHNVSIEVKPETVSEQQELFRKESDYENMINKMIMSGEIVEVDKITEKPCAKY